MKTHDNYVSFSFYDIFLVSHVIQTGCFFFLEKVVDLYEQSSRRVSSPASAYWNPWVSYWWRVIT